MLQFYRSVLSVLEQAGQGSAGSGSLSEPGCWVGGLAELSLGQSQGLLMW